MGRRRRSLREWAWDKSSGVGIEQDFGAQLALVREALLSRPQLEAVALLRQEPGVGARRS
jgi:hypothetical protein